MEVPGSSRQAGVKDFLDLARQTYKAIEEDIWHMFTGLKVQLDMPLELKFDAARQFFYRCPLARIGQRPVPSVLINRNRRTKFMECQTLDLVKMNRRLREIHADHYSLFKISESIAPLDMLAALAQVARTNGYVRPDINHTLAIKLGRHPVRETAQRHRFVPNDVYTTRQHRFQIITGCKMSGKSTYIRSIALKAIMYQVGGFVPASYASFPIVHQICARVSADDAVEADVSSFSLDMRCMASILHDVSAQSLVIIDELGRGTSTVDGLAIVIAIAEALIESQALIWFVTHFHDLPRILAERAGVVNLHLQVSRDVAANEMTMTYKITDGYEKETSYGLELAAVVALPDRVLATAQAVSRALNREKWSRRLRRQETTVARRRKLVLNLHEQLVQAHESAGENFRDDLVEWLKKLQVEFVVRMRAIDNDAQRPFAVEQDDETGEMDGQEHGASDPRVAPRL